MDQGYTIARAAKAAEIGVETVRYYERRGLIPKPARTNGAYRRYSDAHVARIRFIRRAQQLGFTLDEIATLLELEDGADRRSIRRIASQRLEQIRTRLTDLRRMERTLTHLLHTCEATDETPDCPIIAAITSVEKG